MCIVHISREYSQYWEKSLVQLILTTMAMGCGTYIFVDVSVVQLAKASMISWATRISAGPGSIPESKLTYMKPVNVSMALERIKKL